MPITIGALRESAPGETRVSLVPEVVDKFLAAGARGVLEPGAGTRAHVRDALYRKGEWVARQGAG
jgi:NAD(P) transhydrogenase subunit alpha